MGLNVYTIGRHNDNYADSYYELGEKAEADCGTRIKIMQIIDVDFTERYVTVLGVPAEVLQ